MPSEDSIRIVTDAASIRHVMSETIAEFRFRRPQAGFEFVTESSSAGCFTALLKGEADLAWAPMTDAVDGIDQRPVMELPWALAMNAGGIYSDRAWVEVPELSGLRLIRPPAGSTSAATLAAALTNVTFADAGNVDADTALLLAELGVGHAILPRLPGWAQTDDGAVRLVELRGLPPLPVGWATRSPEALTRPARAFANTVTRRIPMKALG